MIIGIPFSSREWIYSRTRIKSTSGPSKYEAHFTEQAKSLAKKCESTILYPEGKQLLFTLNNPERVGI